jgi:hypothetical protein
MLLNSEPRLGLNNCVVESTMSKIISLSSLELKLRFSTCPAVIHRVRTSGEQD